MSDTSDSLPSVVETNSTSFITPSGEVPYRYTRVFQPTGPDGTSPLPPLSHEMAIMNGDRTDGLEYVYSEKIILAVNVAITTGRPLLVSGSPGSGKSSLARSVAKWQGWRYYEEVITSHTQARDLLWRFDTLRRLGDAQVAGIDKNAFHRLKHSAAYIEPGVLWWAFDPASAVLRGVAGNVPAPPPALDPAIVLGPPPEIALPAESDKTTPDWSHRAVVLLDEIDKAEPDVPNDLLIPLGALAFTVAETNTQVSLVDQTNPPLIIITTNRERELPNAFLRRCLTLTLPEPEPEWLVKVAKRHFGPDDKGRDLSIAKQIVQKQDDMNRQTSPGTAEFLDAVRACRKLDVQPDPDNPTWKAIKMATLLKDRTTEEIF